MSLYGINYSKQKGRSEDKILFKENMSPPIRHIKQWTYDIALTGTYYKVTLLAVLNKSVKGHLSVQNIRVEGSK